MKLSKLFLIILTLGLFIATPVLADHPYCETDMMKGGVDCAWSLGESWCLNNTNTCAVESTADEPTAVSNGTYSFSCNSNAWALSCDDNYTNCSGTCTETITTSNCASHGGCVSNCTAYNTCLVACSACSPGYTLSGGACVGSLLKLGSGSVSGTDVRQDSTVPHLYVSGDKLGVGESAPTANLHLTSSTDTEGLRIISSNYSPFVVRNAADTADLFRINEDGTITPPISSPGSTNWILNGSNLYASSTAWNVGIGTTAPKTFLDVSLPEGVSVQYEGIRLGRGTGFFNMVSGTNSTASDFTPTFLVHSSRSGNPGFLIQASPNNDSVIEAAVNIRGAASDLSSSGLVNSPILIVSNWTTPLMTVSAGGNVGISTTTPTTKLSVVGDAGEVLNVNGGRIMGLNDTPVNDDEAVPLGYLEDNYAPIDASSLWSGTLDGNIWNGGSGGGDVGIGTNDPQAKLHVLGDAIVSGTLTVGSLNGSYTGLLAASNISAGTFGSAASGGDYAFSAGLEFPELIAARATYPTLNDRINGVATNYSSIILNAKVINNDFKNSSDVNTSNTTAYYNNQIGSIQNDASNWETMSIDDGYGSSRSMGNTFIYGNKMYSGAYSYGIKIFNLDTETLEKEYNTASTPALANNYWNQGAYDPIHNDLYAGNDNYNNGMIKIDLDTDTITQFKAATSDLLVDNMGVGYDNCMEYYDGRIYFWPAGQYMQTYDVNSGVFTNYGAATGLPSSTCYSTEVYNNELHVSTSQGFYIWNMDTNTLTKRYYSNGPQGLYNYTNTVYSSYQDPYDSDIVWIGTYYSWQKLSKTNGWQEFHNINSDTSLPNYRWTIARIGDQLWLGSYYAQNPNGYLVYDLNAQDYFVIADDGKIIGNVEQTSSYHFQPMYYNGYWYFANYSDSYMAKSQLIYETSNVFETNVLATMTNDITMAKFTYGGGAGTANSLEWYLSADNGTNWEGPVTSGVMWKFSNLGTQLKAKALMTAGSGTTPVIRSVQIAAYDGETWAGEGSNTVETEVLEARNSELNGIFGSLDLRLEDIDTKITALPSSSHNHDSSYLKLIGGTLSGQLTVNANINSNHLLPNSTNAFDIGSSAKLWNNIYTNNLRSSNNINFYGGNFMINDAVITSATPKAAVTQEYLTSSLGALSSMAKYATSTPATYNGSQGGYDGADALCEATLAGSHVCAVGEIIYSISSDGGSDFPASKTLWINSGPPGYTVNANDCIGWTSDSSSDYGTVWVRLSSGNGFGSLNKCDNDLPRSYACCK